MQKNAGAPYCGNDGKNPVLFKWRSVYDLAATPLLIIPRHASARVSIPAFPISKFP